MKYCYLINKKNLFIFFCLFFYSLNGQELKCEVIVNSNLVNQTNQQIFITLENSIREFMNSQVWTSKEWSKEEKINCSFIFNLTNYNNSNNNFEATLQIQSQRPVYESNYSSPLFNYKDEFITFSYEEFQPLFYNSNNFESNLVSILSFYAYLILGLDADSFKLKGGQNYFSFAQRISNLSQQKNYIGWNPNENIRNRYWLIDSLISNAFMDFRTANYKYHREGLDNMSSDQLIAKKNIINSLVYLDNLNNRRPNAFLTQLFFDAKSQEIVNIFKDGPETNLESTKKILKRVAPFFNNKWREIRN
tara:strand:- start:996 stop:1910 length:915 start_codon:yes stop_codon:yes gene_type:complete